MAIGPNGKKLFDKALPKDEGGHVVMAREWHEMPSHVSFFQNSTPELTKEHNLGNIGLEFPPYMMLFIWDYEDKLKKHQITAREVEERMKTILTTYDSENNALSIANAGLITGALSHNYTVVACDSRRLLEEEWTKHGPRNNAYSTLLIEAKRLHDGNPAYARRLDAIEGEVKHLRARDVPDDTINAIIASGLFNPKKNGVIIFGAGHMGGERAYWSQVQGILDEAMTKQHWKVTDTYIGDALSFKLAIMEGIAGHDCATYDHLDAMYVTDRDDVITLPRKVSGKEKQSVNDVRGVEKDIFSCTESPPVEKVFKPWQLDPTKLPGVAAELEDMKKEVEASYAHPTSGRAGTMPRPGRPLLTPPKE